MHDWVFFSKTKQCVLSSPLSYWVGFFLISAQYPAWYDVGFNIQELCPTNSDKEYCPAVSSRQALFSYRVIYLLLIISNESRFVWRVQYCKELIWKVSVLETGVGLPESAFVYHTLRVPELFANHRRVATHGMRNSSLEGLKEQHSYRIFGLLSESEIPLCAVCWGGHSFAVR
jgi:hypothetical protein